MTVPAAPPAGPARPSPATRPETAAQDPRRAAQVVKQWVTTDA